MSDVAISLKNVSKNYRIYDSPADRLKEALSPFKKKYYTDFEAIKNISFDIKKGETVGIVGVNGSGKSTLLQMIAGVLTPTTGEVKANGQISSLLELGAGFNPDFTGIENIYFSAMLMGLSKSDIQGKIDQITKFAEIGEFINRPVKTYSSGMYVRLAFSLYANINPDIFIVDEALAVGDAYFVHRCMLRFQEMQEQGKTILFVSHDSTAVKKLCDKAIWLKDGGIEMIGNSAEVADAYLADLFNRTKIEKTEELNNETEDIPNIDQRYGDHKCVIKSVELFNDKKIKSSTISNDTEIEIKVKLLNNTEAIKDSLILGYVIRDSRGVEIISTNTDIEGSDIPTLSVGKLMSVGFSLRIPLLHPGSYSITVAVSYKTGPEVIVSDWIENALIFQLSSDTKIDVVMRVKSEIEFKMLEG